MPARPAPLPEIETTAGDTQRKPRTRVVRQAVTLPGFAAVALMVLWAANDGGYDPGTWYWGALLLLAITALSVVWLEPRLRLSPRAKWAIACFAMYVAWSYLSIVWAESPGDALQGSNRALLYLLIFTLFAILPWTAEAALVALLAFSLGIGTIAVVLLFRLASADHVGRLVIEGRMAAPTGYFNSTVAVFMIGALLATTLSVRRELPGALRGLLIAIACACLQLAVIGQSRGWLFTLPLVLVVVAALVRNRFRIAVAVAIPVGATVLAIHRLLGVAETVTPAALNHAAQRAGQAALVLCLVAFVLGTVICWIEVRVRQPNVSARGRRALGATLVGLAVALSVSGAMVATHGDPIGFVSRQWNGFSRTNSSGVGSHFSQIGSGRPDFWRVAIDGVAAYPVGGLGQDNYADYYITRRRTGEEPAWPHSLELRLLVCTGLVGFALFTAFLVLAVAEAWRGIRAPGDLGPAVVAAAMLPLVDWLLHGSVDWFWEMPALSAPALGFLGMAVALAQSAPTRAARTARRYRGSADGRQPASRRLAAGLAMPSVAKSPWVRQAMGAVALVAAAVVLLFPFLSVWEASNAAALRTRDPAAALSDLALAARLNPLSAIPGRLGGTIALDNERFAEAEQRYQQAIDREPDGWYAWFGKGLAASALGDNVTAAHDLEVAARIERHQRVIRQALARLDTRHPIKPTVALHELVLAP